MLICVSGTVFQIAVNLRMYEFLVEMGVYSDVAQGEKKTEDRSEIRKH